MISPRFSLTIVWAGCDLQLQASWGSPGVFRFAQNLGDADTVIAYLRLLANATRLAVDTKRLAHWGHSIGGWVKAHTASHDHGLVGAILISAADMGSMSASPWERRVALMADNREALDGVTAEGMADEVRENGKRISFSSAYDGLVSTPSHVLSADDGLAPMTDDLIKAVEAKANKNVTAIPLVTDHGW